MYIIKNITYFILYVYYIYHQDPADPDSIEQERRSFQTRSEKTTLDPHPQSLILIEAPGGEGE